MTTHEIDRARVAAKRCVRGRHAERMRARVRLDELEPQVRRLAHLYITWHRAADMVIRDHARLPRNRTERRALSPAQTRDRHRHVEISERLEFVAAVRLTEYAGRGGLVLRDAEGFLERSARRSTEPRP